MTTLFVPSDISRLFPLLIFIGVGAMIDFGPLLTRPKMALLGAAGISAFPMAGQLEA